MQHDCPLTVVTVLYNDAGPFEVLLVLHCGQQVASQQEGIPTEYCILIMWYTLCCALLKGIPAGQINKLNRVHLVKTCLGYPLGCPITPAEMRTVHPLA